MKPIDTLTPDHAVRAQNFHNKAARLLSIYPHLGERLVYYEAEHEAMEILAVPLEIPTPPRVLAKIARKIHDLEIVSAIETVVFITATSNSFDHLQKLLLALDKLSYKEDVTSYFDGPVIYANPRAGLAYTLEPAYIFENLED